MNWEGAIYGEIVLNIGVGHDFQSSCIEIGRARLPVVPIGSVMSSALATEVSHPHTNLSGWKPRPRECAFDTTGSRALPISLIHCRDHYGDVRPQTGDDAHRKLALLNVCRKSWPSILMILHISWRRERMRSPIRSPRVSERAARWARENSEAGFAPASFAGSSG